METTSSTVISVIKEVDGIKTADVTPEVGLLELGLDSLQLSELTLALESKLGFEFLDEELVSILSAQRVVDIITVVDARAASSSQA